MDEILEFLMWFSAIWVVGGLVVWLLYWLFNWGDDEDNRR